MNDIIMLTFHEPNAERNWEALKRSFPRAKRVDGVRGIREAHQAAADLSETENFYVVDADNTIAPMFNFDHKLSKRNANKVHIWRSANAINVLRYENGGVKLLHKSHFETPVEEYIDFATSLGEVKLHEELSSWSMIDTTPHQAFRAAFREAAKLTLQLLQMRKSGERQILRSREFSCLNIWLNNGAENQNGHECVRGARTGHLFANTYHTSKDQLQLINDFDYIKDVFDGVTFKV